MRKAGKRENFRPHPGGLGQSFLPAYRTVRVTTTPPITFPAEVREGRGEEGGQEEEGSPGPQKLGLHKRVREDARGQAADPGSPKAPGEAPANADISSALEGRAVLTLSSLALTTAGMGRGQSGVNSSSNCVTAAAPASSCANNTNRCGSHNSIPRPESRAHA